MEGKLQRVDWYFRGPTCMEMSISYLYSMILEQNNCKSGFVSSVDFTFYSCPYVHPVEWNFAFSFPFFLYIYHLIFRNLLIIYERSESTNIHVHGMLVMLIPKLAILKYAQIMLLPWNSSSITFSNKCIQNDKEKIGKDFPNHGKTAKLLHCKLKKKGKKINLTF